MQAIVNERGFTLSWPRHLTYGDAEAVQELLKTLSPQDPVPGFEVLNGRLMCGTGLTLFVVREPMENRIVGITSLIQIEQLSKTCGRIEEVVVHEDFRRRGLARFLVDTAIQFAHRYGIQQLELTCDTQQKDVRELYRALGFYQPDITVWCMNLKK